MMMRAAVTQIQSSLIATTGAELAVRARQRLSLLRLLTLIVLCAAMVPPPEAGYAILHISGRAPLMSADTALQAAAVVLGIIALIVFGLLLDVGRIRDQRQQLHVLFAVQPTSIRGLVLGRLFANLAYACGVVVIATVAITTTLLARFGTFPGFEAFILFVCIVSPAVVTAVVIGLLVDLLLPEQPWLRVVGVFMVVLTLAMLALFSPLDMIGITVLKQLIGNSDIAPQLAIGFIKSDTNTGFSWLEFAVPFQQVIVPRLALLAAVLSIGILGGLLLAPMLVKKSNQRNKRQLALTQESLKPSSESAEMIAGGGHASLRTVFIIAFARFVLRSKFAMLLLATAFLIGLLGGSPGFSLTLILFVPFIVFANTQPDELRVAASIEQCEPALSRPGPQFMVLSVIFLPMLLAAAPALLGFELQQAMTALCGVIAISAWLIWTHRVHDFPVLGVSVAGIILYANAFNEVPPAMDVLGLWHSHPFALAISACMAVATTLALLPKKLR